MPAQALDLLAAGLFAAALLHTFAAKQLERLSRRFPRHAGLLHLLGEVEVVFGFWAIVLVLAMALMSGGPKALEYAESRNFFAALGLTAITDNAALTHLGSLITGIPDESKYMLVAGAVAGGGLTVIANEPNPAGLALLKRGLADESVGAGGLLLGALGPTVVAAAALLLL